MKMEPPVAQVLFEMERNGVQIDRAELARQSAELGAELMKLEQEAHAAAGQLFNLNSPKQLQEILFDKMGIPTKAPENRQRRHFHQRSRARTACT